MSNYGGRTRLNPKAREEEEVEELLRAAQDDVLLSLTLDSHSARSSSSSASCLDRDLLRRFEALKLPKLPSDSSGVKTVPPPSTQRKEKHKDDGDDEFGKVLGADLSAMFSALRSSSSNKIEGDRSNDDDDDDDGDEISKVIRWAIDEARLNPSSTDDEEEDEEKMDDDRKIKPSK